MIVWYGSIECDMPGRFVIIPAVHIVMSCHVGCYTTSGILLHGHGWSMYSVESNDMVESV